MDNSNDSNWVTIGPSSRTGNGKFAVVMYVHANKSNKERTSSITISGEGITDKKIKVIQAYNKGTVPESIKLDTTQLTLYFDGNTGESKSIKANILPIETTNKKVVWTSSHPQIVAVNTNAIINPSEGITSPVTLTALSKGAAVITANTVEGNLSAQCTVTVLDAFVSVDCDSLLFEGVGGTDTVKINAVSTWKVSTDSEWLSATKNDVDSLLIIRTTPNTGGERKATIIISGSVPATKAGGALTKKFPSYKKQRYNPYPSH